MVVVVWRLFLLQALVMDRALHSRRLASTPNEKWPDRMRCSQRSGIAPWVQGALDISIARSCAAATGAG